MPRTPIDYSKTIIYKIVCLDEKVDEIYVGHTTDFKSRKRGHKKNCNNEKQKGYNIKIYQFIRIRGGWDNFIMVPVEEFSCENSTQARIREEYWRQELKAQLNSQKAHISEENRKQRDSYSQQQWREKHKEQYAKQRKQYYQQNKEEIAEKNKQKYTCECGSTILFYAKSRHEKSKKHQVFLDTKV